MSWQSVLLLTALSATAWAQQIPLEALEKKFEGKTKETVEVNLDGNMLALAMKFLDDRDSDQAKAKRILADIKAIYVRVWKFEGRAEASGADLEAVRSQLKGWSKIVDVRSSGRGDNAGVYLQMAGERIQGLVVLAADGNELTLVNLVGSMDPANLREIGGTFGIPNLNGLPGMGNRNRKRNEEE